MQSQLLLPSDVLQTLQQYLAEEMQATDTLIRKHLEHPLSLIPQVCQHLIFAGGKRLRPLLTLACAKLHQEDTMNAVPLATIVEFMHTATLLHDDVVDESPLRRGVKTANSLWGNSISILVGDFLFTQAFQLMVELGDLRILKLLSGTTQKIVEGEVKQIQSCSTLQATREDILQVIAAKTAALFGASCEAGALSIKSTTYPENSLYDFGRHLGMIFQILDDVQDYLSSKRGKSRGDDFFAGKITLPALLAYQQGSGAERAFWQRTLEARDSQPQDLTTACSFIMKILPEIHALAQNQAHLALASLSQAPNHPLKDLLNLLTTAFVSQLQPSFYEFANKS